MFLYLHHSLERLPQLMQRHSKLLRRKARKANVRHNNRCACLRKNKINHKTTRKLFASHFTLAHPFNRVFSDLFAFLFAYVAKGDGLSKTVTPSYEQKKDEQKRLYISFLPLPLLTSKTIAPRSVIVPWVPRQSTLSPGHRNPTSIRFINEIWEGVI